MTLRQGSPIVGNASSADHLKSLASPAPASPGFDSHIYHSAALTTSALSRVHQHLFADSGLTFGGMDHSLKDVPIECVRFFRYLNETAQRLVINDSLSPSAV